MNTFLLSIGSNFNKAENITKSNSLLLELYPDTLFSEVIETEPVGDDFIHDFYNQLAVIETDDSISLFVENLKSIEERLGRLSTDKRNGIVRIDLDMLAVNNKVVKKEDFERPYMDTLLKSLKLSIDL
jgi:2-amino-4-hydroxy-6-hydroxymethyldihydropteridine diphosphokinase